VLGQAARIAISGAEFGSIGLGREPAVVPFLTARRFRHRGGRVPQVRVKTPSAINRELWRAI